VSERLLNAPPSTAALFARAGAGAVPGLGRLPFLPSRRPELPDTVLALDELTVQRERLARYNRVCGFRLRDTLPATYPHILAFPLQLALMSDPAFPVPPIGLVHISNRIVQHRAIAVEEALSLRVWATALREHPRGRQFDLHTEVRSSAELIWEETSTNLRRESGEQTGEGAGSGEAGSARTTAATPDQPAPEPTATWRLKGDLGRRYGAVCGDLNPIHLHPFTARLFGFPRAIAHGMWTKARCLAAMEARLPQRLAVEVAFRRPILLPGAVGFGVRRGEEESAFAVQDLRRGTLHLTGSLSAL
jgi:acyl dehydratase